MLESMKPICILSEFSGEELELRLGVGVECLGLNKLRPCHPCGSRNESRNDRNVCQQQQSWSDHVNSTLEGMSE